MSGMASDMGAHRRPAASCGASPGSPRVTSSAHLEFEELASARVRTGHERGAPEPAPAQRRRSQEDGGCEGGDGAAATGARGATTGITGGPNCGPIPTFQTRECGSSGEFLAPATIGNTPTEWTKCIKKKCDTEQFLKDRRIDYPYPTDYFIKSVSPLPLVAVGQLVTVECLDGYRFASHPGFSFETSLSAIDHFKLWTAECSGSGDCSLPARPSCYPMVCAGSFVCPANHTCDPEPTPGMAFIYGEAEISVTCPEGMMLRSSNPPECARSITASCTEDPDRERNGVLLADGRVEGDGGLIALPDCVAMKCGCNGYCQDKYTALVNYTAAKHDQYSASTCAEGYRNGLAGTISVCSASPDISAKCTDCVFNSQDGHGRTLACVPVGCDSAAARAAAGGATFSTTAEAIGYGATLTATCPAGFRVNTTVTAQNPAMSSQVLGCNATCFLDAFPGCVASSRRLLTHTSAPEDLHGPASGQFSPGPASGEYGPASEREQPASEAPSPQVARGTAAL
eukprot:CAMPEP_0180185460 /NCGR_PEP_ID=MMETSP0986-20121125/42407_1 /TAXON_ID=697907 /ORGANISM="non described non described, Strain CCMP2293" /LENGTH=512 /DNA_ID=CAMNT_0022139289 /DNA_START=45 /DNA_END=1580 /DNA_ORIENTATION=+